MRRSVEAFVRGLPLDARSKRVLDETLLDWDHETAEASTIAARAGIELRALLSIARAVVFMSVRDLPRVPVWWLAGRLALFGVLPVAILMSFDRDVWPIQTLRLGIIVLTGWLPLACFYAIASRPAARRLPILAIALCGGALIAAFVLYISPYAISQFFELQLRELNRAYRVAPLPLIPPWWSVAEACGPAALTGSLIVFAEALRNLSRWRRIALLALAPCVYAAWFSGVWLIVKLLLDQTPSWVAGTTALMLFGLGMTAPRPFAFVDAAGRLLLGLALFWGSTRIAHCEPEPRNF